MSDILSPFVTLPAHVASLYFFNVHMQGFFFFFLSMSAFVLQLLFTFTSVKKCAFFSLSDQSLVQSFFFFTSKSRG